MTNRYQIRHFNDAAEIIKAFTSIGICPSVDNIEGKSIIAVKATISHEALNDRAILLHVLRKNLHGYAEQSGRLTKWRFEEKTFIIYWWTE